MNLVHNTIPNFSTRLISLQMSPDRWRAVTEKPWLKECLPSSSARVTKQATKITLAQTMCLLMVFVTESQTSVILTKSIIYSQHQPQRRINYPWDKKRVWRICKHLWDQLRTLCFQSVLVCFWSIFLLLQVKVLQKDKCNKCHRVIKKWML